MAGRALTRQEFEAGQDGLVIVGVKVPASVKQWLVVEARRRGMSVSTLVRLALKAEYERSTS